MLNQRRISVRDLAVSPAESPQGQKFAMWGRRVARLVGVRRSFGALGHRKRSVINENPDDIDDFITNVQMSRLPPVPRFPATLSAEAQFAYLKGYEDLARAYIQAAYPETPHHQFPRTPSPSASSVHLRCDSTTPTPVQHLVPYHGTPESPDFHLPTLECQRKTSYRLENVQDIVDKLRSDKGGIVTSRRFKEKRIQPLPHFRKWSTVWSEEFRVEPVQSSHLPITY